MNIGLDWHVLLDVSQRIDEQTDALVKFGMEETCQEIEQLRFVSAKLRKKYEVVITAERIAAGGK